MRRLLVTGFGPFPSMPRNPSAALARAVAASPRWRIHGVRAQARVLTTSYRALGSALDPALAEAPDAVLMIGVAGRSRTVRVETRATGRRSSLFPDVAGQAAPASGPAGGEGRRTGVNSAAALAFLRARHVPSRLSRDAGRYLCNAAYFRALGGAVPVLFAHIPKGLGPRTARSLADALVQIGLGMLRDGRRPRDGRRAGRASR